MEDGVKDATAKPTEAKFIGKAGWVKKSSGKFLGGYKDRYILIEKTEIVVYENEDLEKCVERVDLEKYDKCCGARSAFQKKNRLVMIPVPKSKVHDIKLQVANPEEKDAWIKALSDAINRAKNKVFDEVKVDESCSLEHVTRSRPKLNQTRRPPTRIHMKEVASSASDGILRLDLDVVDNMPNGTYQVSTETEVPKEPIKPPMPPSKPTENPQQALSEEPSQQTAAIKPPMPPSKDSKPKHIAPCEEVSTDKENGRTEDSVSSSSSLETSSRSTEEAGNNNDSVTQASGLPNKEPPTPPSKDMKPTLKAQNEGPDEPSCSGDSEEDKPEEPLSENRLSASSEHIATEQSTIFLNPKDETAPSNTETSVSEQEAVACMATEQKPSGPIKEEEESVTSNAIKEEESGSKPTITTTTEVTESSTAHTKPPAQFPESVKKSPGPPAPPKKKPLKPPHIKAGPSDVPMPSVAKPVEADSATSDKSMSLAMDTISAKEIKSIATPEDTGHLVGTEHVISPAEIPSTIATGNVITHDTDSITERTTPPGDTDSSKVFISSLAQDPPLSGEGAVDTLTPKSSDFVFVVSNYDTGDNLDFCLEKLDQDEMRSSDSGQHSDDEVESGDNIRASTIALSGSRTRLDEDICEDSSDLMDVSLDSLVTGMKKDSNLSETTKDIQPTPTDHPCSHLFKSSTRGKSPSLGDLLSSSQLPEEPPPSSQSNDINELHCKTLLELKATQELFEKVCGDASSASSCGKENELSAQELLAKAVERLRKADEVLQEARNLRELRSKRMSW